MGGLAYAPLSHFSQREQEGVFSLGKRVEIKRECRTVIGQSKCQFRPTCLSGPITISVMYNLEESRDMRHRKEGNISKAGCSVNEYKPDKYLNENNSSVKQETVFTRVSTV